MNQMSEELECMEAAGFAHLSHLLGPSIMLPRVKHRSFATFTFSTLTMSGGQPVLPSSLSLSTIAHWLRSPLSAWSAVLLRSSILDSAAYAALSDSISVLLRHSNKHGH